MESSAAVFASVCLATIFGVVPLLMVLQIFRRAKNGFTRNQGPSLSGRGLRVFEKH